MSFSASLILLDLSVRIHSGVCPVSELRVIQEFLRSDSHGDFRGAIFQTDPFGCQNGQAWPSALADGLEPLSRFNYHEYGFSQFFSRCNLAILTKSFCRLLNHSCAAITFWISCSNIQQSLTFFGCVI